MGFPVMRLHVNASIKSLLNVAVSPITSSLSSASQRSPTALQLAAALTTLEGDMYQSILPSEYIAHAGRLPSYCPNLLAAIALNQRITNWVQLSILDMDFDGAPDELEQRSDVKRYFLKAARVICLWARLANKR